jgi:hypothetical protein
MSLLDFARGPALQASVVMLLAGTVLRLGALLLRAGVYRLKVDQLRPPAPSGW